MWPFTKYTYEYREPKRVLVSTRLKPYKGYGVIKTPDGDYMVPGLDKESRFDTSHDAKRFIDANTRRGMVNPKKVTARLIPAKFDPKTGKVYVAASRSNPRGIIGRADKKYKIQVKRAGEWQTLYTRAYDSSRQAVQEGKDTYPYLSMPKSQGGFGLKFRAIRA